MVLRTPRNSQLPQKHREKLSFLSLEVGLFSLNLSLRPSFPTFCLSFFHYFASRISICSWTTPPSLQGPLFYNVFLLSLSLSFLRFSSTSKSKIHIANRSRVYRENNHPTTGLFSHLGNHGLNQIITDYKSRDLLCEDPSRISQLSVPYSGGKSLVESLPIWPRMRWAELSIFQRQYFRIFSPL